MEQAGIHPTPSEYSMSGIIKLFRVLITTNSLYTVENKEEIRNGNIKSFSKI
ncbi:hypothetical protein SAMN05216565_1024 [Litchfieldia salsa]|uniref:Uncharacterized protein n=1 Tax=Litchfieldia salsa TaxID=930152 RepID=A0A1H0R320_9BACI|nr:hypothetical protein SAMN05216565_1024 [Litchfieldia salsa]